MVLNRINKQNNLLTKSTSAVVDYTGTGVYQIPGSATQIRLVPN